MDRTEEGNNLNDGIPPHATEIVTTSLTDLLLKALTYPQLLELYKEITPHIDLIDRVKISMEQVHRPHERSKPWRQNNDRHDSATTPNG